jgi:DNA mismatch repair protein MutS2
MLYPKNIEEKIGFDKIRDILKDFCLSSLGRDFVDKVQFSHDYDLICRWIRQTEEFRQILIINEPFPTNAYIDASVFLHKAKIEGAYLLGEEFYNLKLSLETILRCIQFFKNKAETYPTLRELINFIEIDPGILPEINRTIDDHGEVKDSASPELRRIRSQLQQELVKLRKSLNRVLQKAIEQGFTNDTVSLTIRNGRMVIPVHAAYKRSVKGFVHDESATGQTVYIEPEEALETNNVIRELQYEEKREIIKLLTKLTDFIRPSVYNLMKAYQFLGIVDFIRAKAKLALALECEPAARVNQPEIRWFRALHPLLYLSHKKSGKKVVPLTASLDKNQRVLIVSGPNAGGKSVCLKTFALVQYMYQCGLMAPVKESSTLGIFKNLFIDIGDEQSIENDLSTYSSHLNSMKHFANFSDRQTLFLIDEFGSGTDPQVGGAMAEAVLEHLHKQNSFGVITTHYSNLKKFADEREGIVNGAMRFDIDNLEPLFELEIGRPGSSFAIEIARKIGLPKVILNAAKEKIGVDQVKMERLLGQLENDKRLYDQKLQRLTNDEKKLEQSMQKYESLRQSIETNKKALINEAKEKAQKVLQDANQMVEKTIREIKEGKADKELTKVVRIELEEFKKKIKPEKPAKVSAEYETVGGEIKKGDWVKVKGQNTIGQVVALREKDAEITIGELKSKVKVNRLEKITRKEAESVDKPVSFRSIGLDYQTKVMDFSPNLDVRGKRTDEALSIIDQFIDDAILLGQKEVRIVHGKGDGILRKMIRQHLKAFSAIAGAKDEHVETGGAGVTVVELK